MKKTLLFLFGIAFLTSTVWSQKYYTRTGQVTFFSEAPLENIEAKNYQASCIVDIETGEVISKILMKSFQFEKALMQEHFNENYVESNKFPQAILKANVINLVDLNFNSRNIQDVKLEGDLTIHNVTQQVSIKGEIEKKGDIIKVHSSFIVKTADYDIKIPKAVRDNIAKEIAISIEFNLEEFKR